MDVGQAIVAGLIVLTAVVYVAWVLMPAALRLRLAQHLATAARRTGRPAWIARAAGAIERNARRRLGGCSDCSAAQPAPVPPKRLDTD
jgi:hypothetical protein